jgi:hypothetical protein
MKKGFVLGISFMFVMMSFASISGIRIEQSTRTLFYSGNILYVGGSGPGNYSSISEAVDDASDGDTVFVYDDSSPYNQTYSIVINRSINLIGEDRDTVILFNSILIRKVGVNVRGFTFNNSGIAMLQVSFLNDIVISDNHFIEGGIYFRRVNNSYIISNTFYNCDNLLYSRGSKNNRISNNVIIYNSSDENGVDFWIVDAEDFVISNNTFLNLRDIDRTCLLLIDSQKNIIKGNEFNKYRNALSMDDSYKNIICYNNFINNYYKVIWISGSNLCPNRIVNNNFINNSKEAVVQTFNNYWNGNFWDRWIGLRYPLLSFLPYFYFNPFNSFIDWHPAKQPYDITTTYGCDFK